MDAMLHIQETSKSVSEEEIFNLGSMDLAQTAFRESTKPSLKSFKILWLCGQINFSREIILTLH